VSELTTIPTSRRTDDDRRVGLGNPREGVFGDLETIAAGVDVRGEFDRPGRARRST